MPKHPYRDTAIVFGAMALLIPVVAWLTGGNTGQAAVVGALFFVVATGWNWSRYHERQKRLDATAAAAAASGSASTADGAPSSNGQAPTEDQETTL
jgi:membrane protein implicated in regulation of membrane protease activity